jgi:hypothetical protein
MEGKTFAQAPKRSTFTSWLIPTGLPSRARSRESTWRLELERGEQNYWRMRATRCAVRDKVAPRWCLPFQMERRKHGVSHNFKRGSAFVMGSLPAMAAEMRAPEGFASDPANGSNVIPSTAIQKQMFGQRSSDQTGAGPRAEVAALIAVGAPGTEGAPDTQSGQTPSGR